MHEPAPDNRGGFLLPFGAETPERGAVQAASGAQARAVLYNHTLYAGKQAAFETAVARSGASGCTDVCTASRLLSVTHARAYMAV